MRRKIETNLPYVSYALYLFQNKYGSAKGDFLYCARLLVQRFSLNSDSMHCKQAHALNKPRTVSNKNKLPSKLHCICVDELFCI